MRAAVYYSNRDIRLTEMPVPALGAGEVLLRVRASGICGTDVLEWYRMPKAPVVLGHEIAGEVVAVGEGISAFQPGDRVTATHHVPCGDCNYCRAGHETICDLLRRTHFDPGGFAEFLRLPAVNVERGTFKIADHLSYEEASFTEPLGCVVRGQNMATVNPDSCVVVLGSGNTGLLHIQYAKARGAKLVIATDVHPYRLEAARRAGADVALDARGDIPAEVKKLNEGRLADVVVTCVGALQVLDQACRSIDRGGTILMFAPLPPGSKPAVPLTELWWETVSIVSSYAAAPRDLALALDLLSTGRVRVKDLVTHRLPLAESVEAFQTVIRAGESLKVLIDPQL